MDITQCYFKVKCFFSRYFSGEITQRNATEAQLELLHHMEHLSQEYMRASWMGYLDTSLHNAIYNNRGCNHFFLMEPVTKDDYDKLKELFLAVKGWWYFDEDRDFDKWLVFLPFEAWRKQHNLKNLLPKIPLEYEEQLDGYTGNKRYNT